MRPEKLFDNLTHSVKMLVALLSVRIKTSRAKGDPGELALARVSSYFLGEDES